MGNCPIIYNCTHQFKYVCDWNCIPSDYRWTQNDFDYHEAWDKLYKHCKYYHRHNVSDYCDYCMVKCDKVYEISLQEYDSWFDTHKYDLCYDLKFPDGNRLQLNRIYQYCIDDLKFQHRCINCDCTVVYTLNHHDYGYDELNSLRLNNRYMFCYDCYIQKQADFGSNDISYNYDNDYFDSAQDEYYSTKTFKCNCMYNDGNSGWHSYHQNGCDTISDGFNINDFLSGNLLIKRE
jgi:hypothetical protein